jgi:hypothetical protein
MVQTVTAIFDGEVLRPESSVNLKSNTRYVLTLEEAPVQEAEQSVWDFLEELAGSIEAPADWSEEHDHYLYHTPKRNVKTGDE